MLVVQDHLVRLKAFESVFVANTTNVQSTSQLHCNLHFLSFQLTWPLATIMFYKYFTKLHNKNNFRDKTLHLGDRKNYIAISLTSVIKKQYVRAWICNKLHTENITDLFLLSLCALILYLSCAPRCAQCVVGDEWATMVLQQRLLKDNLQPLRYMIVLEFIVAGI